LIEKFTAQNAYLSNFHPSPIEYDGETYPTVEHAFQAAKTHNPEHKRIIREKDTPGKAKRAGSKRGKLITLRSDWEQVKLGIMEELVRRKFQDPGLQAQLEATGDQELQEGNNWNDTFWGVNLKTGNGQNHLGRILMQIRAENR
jgi:ribA/ribD-fused uncharacterized protein